MTLHVELQRLLPTQWTLRETMDQHRHVHGCDPTYDEVLQSFPGVSATLIDATYRDLLIALPQENAARFACEERIIAALGRDRDAGEPAESRNSAVPATAAARTTALLADELTKRVDSFTHPQPPLVTNTARRTRELAALPLSHEEVLGFEIAKARGLRLLVDAYRKRLTAQTSEDMHKTAEAEDGFPRLGENIGAQQKYEHLPISAVLLAILRRRMSPSPSDPAPGAESVEAASTPSLLTVLSERETQECLWEELERLHAVVTASFDANLVAVSSTDASALSPHERVLGGVAVLVRARGADIVNWHAVNMKPLRLRQKGCPQVWDANPLLTVFAIAAFVEMTEHWYRVPTGCDDNARIVNNMDAVEARSLCKLVHDEHNMHSLPLASHLCAMCGRLLAPTEGSPLRIEDVGRRGGPFQVRGTRCSNPFAMPPFLLLYSKNKLAARLPAVFTYNAETNVLSLRRQVLEYPWMAYTGPAGPKTQRAVDAKTPWWHCLPCWRYYTRRTAKGAPFYSDQRIPMRNWFEGHFTKWHVDLAYPHLYPHLRRLYPNHRTLPSVADVLAWRERRDGLNAAWHAFSAEVRVLPPAAQRARRRVLEDTRAELAALEEKWAPPAHKSYWGTPMPAHFLTRQPACLQRISIYAQQATSSR